MKKIYLFIGLLTMTATASAQILGEGKKFSNDEPDVIPGMFTYSGQPLLYWQSCDDYEDLYYESIEKIKVSIYDGSFEMIHEIEIPIDNYEVEFEYQKLNTETNEWEKTDGSLRHVPNVPEIEWIIDADETSWLEFDGFLFPTQTLYNEDEKFEYITLNYNAAESVDYESDSDGDGVMDYRRVRKPGLSGFNIVQKDGTVLQTIESNCSDGFCIYKISGNVYLYDGSSVYLIDRKANSVKRVNTLPGMRVRPSVVDRNQQVTVDLDDDASEIQVVNAAGQTIKRIPVGEGQRQVTFNTRGMNSGVNVVRSKGRNAEASRKFIVK